MQLQSFKPQKQRKFRFQAPMHVLRKNVSAHLAKDLRQKYKKTRSKIYAHIPDGISVNEGDRVSVGETRKISKTKSFVVLKVLEREKKKVKSEEK